MTFYRFDVALDWSDNRACLAVQLRNALREHGALLKAGIYEVSVRRKPKSELRRESEEASAAATALLQELMKLRSQND